MNRPQIISPNTGKIINLFSKEIEELLDNGYTIEEIMSYPILSISKNIPLTGYKDFDTEMFLNLDVENLRSICSINKYTKNICDGKIFWVKKFQNDNLEIPNLKIDDINWFHLYDVSLSVKEDMRYIKYFGDIEYKLVKRFYDFDLNHYLKLINQEEISLRYNDNMKIKNITISSLQDYNPSDESNESDESDENDDKFRLIIENFSRKIELVINKETLSQIISYLKYDYIIYNQQNILCRW